MRLGLYRTDVNLNRLSLTARAFGVERIVAYRCSAPAIEKLRRECKRYGIEVDESDGLPVSLGLCALETDGYMDLRDVPWRDVREIVVGGLYRGLPTGLDADWRVRIPTIDGAPLTVEGAAAVALWESWR